MKKLILLFFLMLILGGLYFYQDRYVRDEGEVQVLRVGDNMLYVAGQAPGNFINVQIASLSEDGYIVIYENNDDNLGGIIGNSALLKAGDHENVFVGLVRPVVRGESLFAVIHKDSGDGIFSPNLDIPLLDDDGNMTFMIFEVDDSGSRSVDISL